jgi:hypothetical protein
MGREKHLGEKLAEAQFVNVKELLVGELDVARF